MRRKLGERMNDKNVPVVLSYDYSQLVGHARFEGDVAHITLTDPRLLKDIKIHAVSLDIHPLNPYTGVKKV
jgi:hypothetical protein